MMTHPPPSDLYKSFLSNDQATDPVWKSDAARKAAERIQAPGASTLHSPLQPASHCEDRYLPSEAGKLGLERWIPSSAQALVPSRGVNCRGRFKCHQKGFQPAFFYTREDLVCSESTKQGLDTLVCRWDPSSKKKPVFQSCWNCYCSTKQSCSIGGRPLEVPEEYEPEEEEVAALPASTPRAARQPSPLPRLSTPSPSRARRSAGQVTPANTLAGPTSSSKRPATSQAARASSLAHHQSVGRTRSTPQAAGASSLAQHQSVGPSGSTSQVAGASSLAENQSVEPSGSTQQVTEASSSVNKNKGKARADDYHHLLNSFGNPIDPAKPIAPATSDDDFGTEALDDHPGVQGLITNAQSRLSLATRHYREVIRAFQEATGNGDPFEQLGTAGGGYTYLSLAARGTAEVSSVVAEWSMVLEKFCDDWNSKAKVNEYAEQDRFDNLQASFDTKEEDLADLRARFAASERTAARLSKQVDSLNTQLRLATDNSSSTLADITRSKDEALADRDISERMRLDLVTKVDELEATVRKQDVELGELEEEVEELREAEVEDEVRILATERKALAIERKAKRALVKDLLESSPRKRSKDDRQASVP